MIGRTKVAWGAAIAAMAVAGAVAWAQTREAFTAFGVNMNAGRAGVVDIVIDRWSPDGDREALLNDLPGVFRTS